MKKLDRSKVTGVTFAILTSCVTLAISPKFSYDAFTTFKLVFLYGLGSLSLYIALNSMREIRHKIGSFVSLVILLFIADALLILISSQSNFYETFYGQSGRYTGFGTYLSLILIFTASIALSSFAHRKRIMQAIELTGIFSTFYCLIQLTGNDFFVWSQTVDINVVGFLGNPNFASAFQALVAIVFYSKLVDSNTVLKLKIFYILMFFGAFWSLIGAKSTQGFIILVFGVAMTSYFYLRHKFASRFLSNLILVSTAVGCLIGMADIFQKTPWNPVIYSYTVSIRGDYWRAALNMAADFPFLGVGFDGFSNFYRRSRDAFAYNRLGSETPVDSAHNVFLDYASNGGLLFLALNILLIFFVVRSAKRYIDQSQKFDMTFIIIFIFWLSLIIQSMISINQLGLAIWSWVLGGLILGAENQIESSNKTKHAEKTSDNKRRFDVVFIPSLTLIVLIGSLVASPIVVADHKFKLAIDKGNATELSNSAILWPPNTNKMVLVTAALTKYKFFKEARDLSIRTLEINPDSFEAWRIYAANPLLTDIELMEVKTNLIRLDPNIVKFEGIEKYLTEGKK